MARTPRIYIGNIPYDVTEDEIRKFFAPREVVEVKIITDRDTGRPRGFGFVELKNPADLADAVQQLNGADLGGRAATVSEAKEREQRGGGGGGGGHRGSGGGGGGRGGGNGQRRGRGGDYA